ncbi:diguanylate cyclase [Kangiella taiwanensis]|uniref:diguanylate cyclase n=1 Tax=Kangiella taiwanensis TaxID=1079179 RepID=A0ABP8I7K6_9GAMM|nr:diguanylate cyclase [Kangiella taiwanensis]
MIGRLHYATIAISILLVAILLAASKIVTQANLVPIKTDLSFYDLKDPEQIKNLNRIHNVDIFLTKKTQLKQTHKLYRIPNTIKQITNPLLVITPGLLEETRLYQLERGNLQLLSKSTRYDFNSAPEFMAFQHSYNLQNITSKELYLYVEHYRETSPVVEIWEYETFNRLDNQYNQLYTAIFFGILLLILVNVFFYLIIKRREYLLYIFYNSTFLVFLMGSTGYIYQFPALSFLANNKNTQFVFLCLSMYGLYSFTQAFLSTKKLAPVEHQCLTVFRGAMLLYFITGFIFFPIPQIIVNMTNLTLVLAFPLYVWLVVKLLRRSNRQAFFFSLAFALLILAGVCRILTTFDILPMNFIFSQGFAIASLLEATIFTLGLADRVLQLKTQRDTAQKEYLERSQAYELQKNFSTLLNNITQKLHTSKSQEYETIVVSTFLKDLRKRIKFVSAAAIYQMDDKIHIYTATSQERQKYSQVIRDNSLQIKRLCDLKAPKRLEADIIYEDMFVIPVTMRRHEWSCLILEVDDDFKPTESMLDFLQHYATELTRCLLNIESLRLIKTKAETDDLTRLLNRGAIVERLELNLVRAQRNNDDLSIAFLDVDDFKNVNDTFGHETGDRCLKNLANLLLEELPNNSLIGRYGGDEFLIILPKIGKFEAKRYLKIVSEKIIPMIVENQTCRYTISVGVSSLKSDTKDSLQLIREADKALYVSKNQGKNQINLAK